MQDSSTGVYPDFELHGFTDDPAANIHFNCTTTEATMHIHQHTLCQQCVLQGADTVRQVKHDCTPCS